ncbi:hypothetical protein JRO89_XS05G0249200 [Xanthoceras sorbifolium]|uniref:VPS9 domain-containing protein n=1 Tax=Xanthoceras sorbifolium TaxID=99658 RepID=A0ABQ8I3Y3_9ROSI|nr:hypothetical protein JRO89_XS05G0249200 [Xanthoceras sorbifolium]
MSPTLSWRGRDNLKDNCVEIVCTFMKELHNINAFKAPREKLLCIMSCCRVINNLLPNASMSENVVLAAADDFLSVLIYVAIKASYPCYTGDRQNLFLKQLIISQSLFPPRALLIVDLNAKSLSIEENEFEESMQAARLANKAARVEVSGKRETRSGGSNYSYMEVEAGELTVRDVERLLSLYKDVALFGSIDEQLVPFNISIDDAFENACMEFDEVNLRPTYKISL